VERDTTQQNELENKRVELGFTPTGSKKPKVCWDFVKTGKCTHGWVVEKNGGVEGGRWHPGEKEAKYLGALIATV
jgi:hypothetical protein